MPATTGALALSFGLRFHDLYDLEGLGKIDAQFRRFLEEVEEGLSRRLTNARADAAMDRKAESELMVELAPHVEDFLAILFGIAPQVHDLQARHHELAPVYSVKRLFVQRRAVKGKSIDDALLCDGNQLERDLVALFNKPFSELAYARLVSAWLADEKQYAARLEVAASYALWAVMSPAGQARHSDGVLFKIPHKINPDHLVPLESVQRDDICTFVGPSARQRHRSAFHLTDSGAALSGALDEANYCIWCHNQGKDSCSKGLRDKKSGEFEQTPAGVALAGCPLDERISEMNLVKSRGYSLGALATVTVDNPICAATGHRICNECMKVCIAIDSINSPMQCMMKEICGQCLQLQRDPDSNEEKIVFSCLNQDQLLDHVDFSVLRDRLSQNGAQEHLTGCWIRKCLSGEPGRTLQ